jgi:hypothetical protein
MRSVRMSELDEELAFMKKAAEYFAAHPSKSSYGDIEPDTFLALRWGLGEDCVLVLKLAELWQHTPTNYQNVIDRTQLVVQPAPVADFDDLPF